MSTKSYSYIGKGAIYLGPTGADALRPIGNASALELEVEEEEQRQTDYQSDGGGAANIVQRIESVSANITMLEISPKNLALALRGHTSEDESGEVTAEVHEVKKGHFIPLQYLPDEGEELTVQKEGGGEELTKGTDYERHRAGIQILNDAPNVTDGDKIEVDYHRSASDVVQALTESAKEYRMFFDGLNEAQGGRRVAVDVRRIQFSPAESLSLIGDEFGELPVSGELLSDPSVTGNLSRFFQVRMAQ